MILDKPYNKELFDTFLKAFLPDYQKDERPVRTPDGSILIEVTQLGVSRAVGITVLEAECEETDSNKRIAITQAAFKVLRDHSIRNALVAFHDGNDQWRLSLLTSTLEIKDGKVIKKDSNPRRYSYLLGVGAKTVTPYKYLVEKGRVEDIKQLQERFSVEVVNKQFYASVAELFTKLVGGERGATKYPGLLKINSIISQNVEHQEFAVRLIGRIIFSWFLKEKKSAAGVPIVPNELLSLDAVASNADYYHSILEPLFFELLNKRVEHRHESLREAPFSTVPYLNGGLFSPQRSDFYNQNSFNGAGTPGLTHIPDGWFTEFFTVLEQYNFTVDENTSYDVDLSIDPEMLGRIFENLLAEINPETGESARKSTGSFYTPREIVDYMVDTSLLEFLKSKTGVDEDKLKALISWGQDDDELHPLTNAEKEKVVDALATLTILDPACGSGAFPIGVLQKVVYILQQADEKAELWLRNQLRTISSPELRRDIEEKYRNENYDYLRKLGVIRDSIFGVDIQTIATEISKLRCFLTLIIEEDVDDSARNRGIRPLPNLDFKFVTANSLIGLPASNKGKGLNLFEDASHIDRLKDIRNRYFGADADERARLQVEFKDLQLTMFRSRLASMGATSDLYNTLSDWNPFNHEKTGWFDSEWMFGIDSFNLVIANPPYVDSENMKKNTPQIRVELTKLYETARGNWDLYVPFIELGNKLLGDKGILIYITPNKWLGVNYGQRLREYIAKKLRMLVSLDAVKVFDAGNNPIILMSSAESPQKVEVNFMNREYFIASSSFTSADELDVDNFELLLSSNRGLLRQIGRSGETFSKYFRVENPFSTAEAYELLPVMQEMRDAKNEYFRFCNTGTITAYGNLWDSKSTRYLKKVFFEPIVSKDDFISKFPKRFSQTNRPKVIIKGMRYFDSFYDEQGEFIAGKSTIIATPLSDTIDVFGYLGVLNSALVRWWLKELYSSQGIDGGINFTTGMVEKIPIANNPEILGKISHIVKAISQTSIEDRPARKLDEINSLVYKLYDLTSEEIAIVEGQNGSK